MVDERSPGPAVGSVHATFSGPVVWLCEGAASGRSTWVCSEPSPADAFTSQYDDSDSAYGMSADLHQAVMQDFF